MESLPIHLMYDMHGLLNFMAFFLLFNEYIN